MISLCYRNDLERIAQASQTVADFGIIATGRQGSFNYLTAHLTAVAAQELAQSIQQAGAVMYG